MAEVGLSGGEADSSAGVLMFMFTGGVVVGDFLPGVDGGVEGTLGGGVISPSGGRMIAVPAPPLC